MSNRKRKIVIMCRTKPEIVACWHYNGILLLFYIMNKKVDGDWTCQCKLNIMKCFKSYAINKNQIFWY